ncbi:capsule biosynthesis protein [Yoonia sp. 2307UL14-13]|uniref:capsule biosynthesis protein n=1 Tax=Yoonia sp. 2307UL14-13 TaxID=3126506 RepID=UPI0030ACFE19
MTTPRHFLFLQGPHGPFFAQLAQALRKTGAHIWRVGFNAGDQAFWRGAGYVPYLGPLDDWAETCRDLIAEHRITDLVLYGDVRPVHAEAVAVARAEGLRIHVFEEGYLRPYWVTYERGGSNGHSRLMQMSVAQMCAALAENDHDMHPPPAVWGDMRQHMFYGALYHWFVLFRNRRYRNFVTHRDLSVGREALLYTKRLFTMPYGALSRYAAQRRIRYGGFPYHLMLLQLEHDASFRAHSPFADMEAFLQVVIDGFAAGAPSHHHLVLKAHPLEIGRVPLRRIIARMAGEHGIAARVHFVRGGKLAPLLDQARSAVTVNSTAAQQALWRGIPLKAFGTAVYDKPEFVSDQALPDFFANPRRPDARAYREYRRFLLETCQVPGGFYSARGRRQLLREVVDMMLADVDPYDALQTDAPRRDFRVVG